MDASAPRPSVRRRLAGLVAGVLALVVLAHPLLVTALLTFTAFSGCFLDCGPPQPGRGILWSLATAVLLAAPIFLGLAAAGVRSRRVRLAAAGAVLVAVTAWAVLALLA